MYHVTTKVVDQINKTASKVRMWSIDCDLETPIDRSN